MVHQFELPTDKDPFLFLQNHSLMYNMNWQQIFCVSIMHLYDDDYDVTLYILGKYKFKTIQVEVKIKI